MLRLTFNGLAFLLILLGLCPAAGLRAEVILYNVEQPARFIQPSPDFFAAAATGNVAELQKALAEGVSPDAVLPMPAPPEVATLFAPHTRGALLLNDAGATALMLATAAGQTDAMAVLLAAKANREARTHSGLHPLDMAAERNDLAAMQLLLGVTPESDAARLSILVDLAAQRAILSRDGQPVITTKISSGRKERPTPPGKYVITQKYTEWHSTLYHNASMPYFLRLSCSAVGLHAGVVPNYPASHGCVRLPPDVAHKFYQMVPRGTVVEIR